MKGSLHLATITGIPVKIHWTFGLLLLWVAYETTRGGFDPLMVLISIGIVLSVFFCVILHEFGHTLAARRFGVQTFDIMMTPIGGIARLERMPEGRGQEFWVAIAGPLVNFAIITLIWLGYFLIDGIALPVFRPSFWNFNTESTSYFKIIMLANGYLGIFNLLPAFPMDGGRMLRSLLSLRMSREQATRIASYAGQVISAGMFAWGIYKQQPTLTLIGVFIFFAARQEYKVIAKQARIMRLNAALLMEPLIHKLFIGQTLVQAREAVNDDKWKAEVVWPRPGIPAGYIDRKTLFSIPPDPDGKNLIDAFVIPAPVVVSPQTSLPALHQLMRSHDLPLVLVYEGYYQGIIRQEKLRETIES